MLLLITKNIFKHHNEITKSEFIASDFGFNPRSIWKLGDLGIVEVSEGRGWQKFSIVEVFWLKLVGILQSYGLPTNVIIDVKTHISKKYGTKKNEGMVALFTNLLSRADIMLQIRHEGKGFSVAFVEPTLNQESHHELSPFSPILTIPLLGIIKSIIQNPNKIDDNKYIMAMIRYGILTVPEVELLLNIREGDLTSIIVESDDKTETVDEITEDMFLSIILKMGYSKIIYNSINGQEVKFNYYDSTANSKN